MLYPSMSCILASKIRSKILAIEVGEIYPKSYVTVIEKCT
jgi:hypothetical protein